MTSALFIESLAPLRADPAGSAVLLDIDGTLAPIVENAADASVPETTRQLMIAISRRYGLLACISGRRASEARAMVSIGTIAYLGSHGAELLKPGWTEAQLDPAGAQSVGSGLAGSLRQHLSGQTGGIVNGMPTGNFEFWPFDRWKNEPERDHTFRMLHRDLFQYLHNFAFPRYLLRFSIQISMG